MALLVAHNPLDLVFEKSDALVGPWWMTKEAPMMTQLSKVETKSTLDMSKIPSSMPSSSLRSSIRRVVGYARLVETSPILLKMKEEGVGEAIVVVVVDEGVGFREDCRL